MNRRDFLQLSAILPTLGINTNMLANSGQPNSPPILLLVELKGANDSLNTLIPIDDPNYYRLRPKIAIQKQSALNINNGAAMHSSMKELMPFWQSGNLAWVQGLGYPEPNRSHFRSIEIWETGNSEEYDSEGWLHKLHTQQVQQLQGVVVGSDVGPLIGEKFDTIIMQDTRSFTALTKKLKQVRATSSNSALSRVLNVQNNVHKNSLKVINALAHNKGVNNVVFPKSKFAKHLEQTANLITRGLGANIFKVELSGFDTHRGQERRHKNLLKQLSQGLSAFSKVMQQSGNWDNTVIMTYSEFGRRAAENKSGGTDHGTAAAQLVMGGRVRGGLHGTAPRLDRLDANGDMVYTSDFRSLYHTIATQWLGTPSPWDHFPAFQLIHS